MSVTKLPSATKACASTQTEQPLVDDLQAHIPRGLHYAIRVVDDLHDAGITVLSVVVAGSKPVIQIDAPAQWIGHPLVFLRRESRGGEMWDTYCTETRGCQLEWHVRTPGRTA